VAVTNSSESTSCPNSYTPDGRPVYVFVLISESSLLLSFVRATKYFVSLPVNAIIIQPPEIVRPRRYYLALLLLQSLLPVCQSDNHAPLRLMVSRIPSRCQFRAGSRAAHHTMLACDGRIPSCPA